MCVCVCVCWEKIYKGREDDHIAGVFCRGVGSNLLKTDIGETKRDVKVK